MSDNRRTSPRRNFVSPFSERGYFDKRLGFPYALDYERWSKVDQINYENGRLRAAGAMTLYARVPLQQTKAVRKRVNGHNFIPFR